MTYHQVLLLENDYDENEANVQNPAARNNEASSILAIESQLKQLWGEMSAVRQNYKIKDEIKELELVRLIEVYNKLDIELQRKLELYTKHFMDSLKFYELGIKPSIQGGVKCFIQPPSEQKAHGLPSSSQSSTENLIPPYQKSNDSIEEHFDTTRNGIVQQRKAEITQTLIELNRRNFLTPEDLQLKDALMEELKSLQ